MSETNEIPRIILKKYKEVYEEGNTELKIIIKDLKNLGYKLTQKKFKTLIDEMGDSGSEHETLETTNNENNEETENEEEVKTNQNEEEPNNVINQDNSLIDNLNVEKAQSEQIEYEVPKITIEERPKQIQFEEYKPAKSEKNYSFIRNIDASNVDELKEKRSCIIIIRQYINVFPNQLKFLYGNDKKKFEKSLFTLQLDKLKIILENIRVELNLFRNKTIFMDTAKSLLIGYEKIACYSGFNIENISNELLADPDFVMDLQIISAEIDISKYVNAKTSVLMKVLYKSYEKFELNKNVDKLKKNFDADTLNKMKNIK